MKNEHWPPGSRIFRQIRLYHYLIHHKEGYRGPKELKQFLCADTRMLQRDLKDIRDAGLLNLKYQKKNDNYIDTKEPAAFTKKPVKEKRREHLLRLRRLCILMDQLEGPDPEEVDQYESALYDYQCELEYSMEDPETFPPDEIEGPPKPPEFPDVKAQYEALFPGQSTRTRQRDFETLSKAGYTITYHSAFKAYVIRDFIGDELDDPWANS